MRSCVAGSIVLTALVTFGAAVSSASTPISSQQTLPSLTAVAAAQPIIPLPPAVS